ncbi:IS3 family transposase [Pandoraea cepalis]|uniref:IS3 family transposase n=1 Tax=Pandoraea cepalis TaxID=2508294 RepID=UPI003F5CBC73
MLEPEVRCRRGMRVRSAPADSTGQFNILDAAPQRKAMHRPVESTNTGISRSGNALRVGLKGYIDYYNRHRIKSKLGGLSPVEYRMRAGKN